MTHYESKQERPTKQPRVLWQQPLLYREDIEANFETRDAFIKSLPELEAAFSLSLNDPQAKDIQISPESAKEALLFYNLVVTDGRYIELMKTDPEQTAGKLGVQISSEVVDAILQGAKLRGAASQVNEITITTILVMDLVLAVPDGEIVIDHSKRVALKA